MAKNFHDVRNSKKFLSYGGQNGMGPFGKRPGKKKASAIQNMADGGIKGAAPGAADTEDGKLDPAVHKTSESTPIVGGAGEGSQV